MEIGLPKDAEGREIPLDSTALYDRDGLEVIVRTFAYFTHTGVWRVTFSNSTTNHDPSDMYLTPPDSWEKLEEDIRRIGTDDCTWFCGYANENPVGNACPDSCKFLKGDEITCRKKLADDILSRIRKLRGESE